MVSVLTRLACRRATWLWVVSLTVAPNSAGQSLETQDVRASAVTIRDADASENGFDEIDIDARFEQFQRDLARDLGFKPPETNTRLADGERSKTGLEARWEGSAAHRWYQRLSGVYQQVEGLYDRIEMSTRWATSGFEVDPDVERVFDGKLGLQIERRVAGFDMGVNVDDAVEGRLGFRVGGMVRGYKVSFDVSDVVEAGRFGFQLRRMTR